MRISFVSKNKGPCILELNSRIPKQWNARFVVSWVNLNPWKISCNKNKTKICRYYHTTCVATIHHHGNEASLKSMLSNQSNIWPWGKVITTISQTVVIKFLFLNGNVFLNSFFQSWMYIFLDSQIRTFNVLVDINDDTASIITF